MKLGTLQDYYVRYKIIIFPVIVALVAILIIYFVIYQQINKYLAGQEEINRLNDRINRLSTKSQALESLDVSGLDSKLKTALVALPEDKDLTNLIGQIQKLAQDNNIILLSLALSGGSADKGGKFNPFTIRLEVGGGSDSFKTFINNLEKAPRVMKVVALELSPSRASNSASANTMVELYYAPTPREIGALDAPIPTISSQEEEVLSSFPPPEVPITTETPVTDVPKGKPNPFQ